MTRLLSFLFASLVFTATVFGQKPKVKSGWLANHAFFAQVQRSHGPEFFLGRHSGLYDPRKGKTVPGGTARIFGTRVLRDSVARYQLILDPALDDSLLGQSIEFVLEPDPANGSSDTLRAQIYAPPHFRVAGDWAPPRISSAGDLLPTNEIKRKSIINWNGDPKNDKGVFVSVHFDSRMPANRDRWEQSGPWHDVRHWMQVQDTGSVMLPAALFRDIPDGVVVTLMLFRGNWAFMHRPDGTPGPVPFIAGSYVLGKFIYRR
jgi:hypothetical protein